VSLEMFYKVQLFCINVRFAFRRLPHSSLLTASKWLPVECRL